MLYRAVFLGTVTYAAKVWGENLRVRDKRKLLSSQRAVLLSVTRCFRSASGEALCIIAGVPPIDLIVWERVQVWGTERGDSLRKETKDKVIDQWERRWATSINGRHTRSIWPTVKDRLHMKGIRVNYHLSQVWSGHGRFRANLQRLGLADGDACLECGAAGDDVDHAVWNCSSISAAKSSFQATLSQNNRDRPWRELLYDEETRDAIQTYLEDIIRRRETTGLYAQDHAALHEEH
ncbi:UNVERIFIED_CONTAM: hypothetical protein PYX00_010835 [Menopon gallinae]|uniref:Reverse transcriptase n=1 Tax=Menopon gallinae TaxID=328185 RepID=A0AAW2H6W1_9NEOP